MILRIKFLNGTKMEVPIPAEHGRIAKLSVHYPKRIPKPKFSDNDFTWTGLWLTSKDTFIEVISSNEAYVLNNKGERAFRGQITKNGILWVFGETDCLLMQRKRREETKVQGTDLEWPQLNAPQTPPSD